ncbi:murein hydrolase activator EnvC [Alicyclobacillus sp. SO9]|uniref:murein hydrolase activator EnvC family protein n=1 Tax=Alicyclobacillus sp. SO9 TaxID=2665646 RepID=UPI0018E85E54|nr:peptidoglycan DD-metalloendopeptidase family protein [Alicyclobacillus sp. SO9]QQE78591.1 peptidoglycan DD-metalloendopeptidase family protein [Alicyclobacillus sp. SO9]
MALKGALVMLSSVSLTAGMLLSSVAYANSLTQAEHKSQTLKNQKQQTKKKIQVLTSRAASLQSQIQTLQVQLSNLQQQISQNQADIDKRTKQIAQLKDEITTTQTKLQTQYGILQSRLKIMYEDGHASYLAVLFSSTSFSEMLSRFELLTSIAAEDKKIVKQIQKTKKDLSNKNKELETQQTIQKRVYAALLTKRSEQKQKQQQQAYLLKQVNSAKLAAQADLKQESEALSSLASKIAHLKAAARAYHGSATGWTWPVPTVHRISSPYGWRMLWGHKDFHPGVDIPGASGGEQVVAATSGQVLYAGPASGYGHWIVVESAGNLMEIYGHIVGLDVHAGEIVHTGEPLATIGAGIQGLSTGPHLHFQVGRGGVTSSQSTNPLQFVHP